MALRRLLPLFVALSIGAAACGSGDRPTQVAAGGDPEAATSTTEASAPSSTTSTAPATTTSTAAGTVTTTPSTTAPSASADAGPSDASPVAGLDASQLQQAVEAPASGAARSRSAATADQVTLADGTRVWRVRVPGSFEARSARVAISVGSRVVGEGVLAGDLTSITAVTTDGTGLSAGQPVSFQWEGGPSIAAGTLAVIR